MSLERALAALRADLAAARRLRSTDDHAVDRVAFAESLGLTLDDWQAALLRSSAPRHIVLASRQSGKSTVCALMALHQAVYRPNSTAVVVSPSLRQSIELFRRLTDLRRRLPLTLEEDNRTSCTIAGGGRVVSLPGTERTVRGLTADLVIVDEAARVPDELMDAVRPMLSTTGGRLVMVSTAYGKTGVFYRTWTEGEGWERTLVTAEQVPRISPAFLEQERAELPARVYESEYLCRFVEPEGAVFDHDDITAAVRSDVRPFFTEANHAEPA